MHPIYKGVFKCYISRFLQILDPHPVVVAIEALVELSDSTEVNFLGDTLAAPREGN